MLNDYSAICGRLDDSQVPVRQNLTWSQKGAMKSIVPLRDDRSSYMEEAALMRESPFGDVFPFAKLPERPKVQGPKVP